MENNMDDLFYILNVLYNIKSLCKHVNEHNISCTKLSVNETGYCQVHSLAKCMGSYQNGKECTHKPVYMGFCRTHGKHIMADEKDPYVLIKTGNYQLFKDRVTKNQLDVNYVKNGKTVLHRLLIDKDVKNVHKYCTVLAKNGLDINKCSTDDFADMEGNVYYNTDISPILYLLNFPQAYKSNKGDIVVRKLLSTLEFNFDQHYNGIPLLERALQWGYYGFIEQASLYGKDEVLRDFRDTEGRSLISSFIHRYAKLGYWSKKNLKTLQTLFENNVLANIRGMYGYIPAFEMLLIITAYSNSFTTQRMPGTYYEFFGASDFSLTNNDNISTLEQFDYKNLNLGNVYWHIDQLKKGQGNRNAIKSLLDIIFTLKLIVKRREKGLCRLVGNNIEKHLLALYV